MISAASIKTHFPAANTAAVVTFPAGDFAWSLLGVLWSYSGDPTGGGLTISDGTTTLDFDITKGGPSGWQEFPCVGFKLGAALTVTLKAGGAGVTGKLNVAARA